MTAITSKGRRASVVGNVNENTMRAPEPSEEECLAQATRAFARILNLSTEDQLKDKLTIRDYKPGENITKQNDLEHINHLYYIIWGKFPKKPFVENTEMHIGTA